MLLSLVKRQPHILELVTFVVYYEIAPIPGAECIHVNTLFPLKTDLTYPITEEGIWMNGML